MAYILIHAYRNPQMMIYALGALELFRGLYEFDSVIMHIFQPRRENYSASMIPVDQLKKWANDVLIPKAALAQEGGGEFAAGDWCVFCTNAPVCRARAISATE